MPSRRRTRILVGAALLVGLAPLATSQDPPSPPAPRVGVVDYEELAAAVRELPAYRKARDESRALSPKERRAYRDALERHLYRELRALVGRFGRRFSYERIHWLSSQVCLGCDPEAAPRPPGLAFSRAECDVTEQLLAYLRDKRTLAWLGERPLPASPLRPPDASESLAPQVRPRLGVVDGLYLAKHYARKPLFDEALAKLTERHSVEQRSAYQQLLEEQLEEEIATTVRNYGKRYGYTLLLDRGSAVLHHDPASEVTKTVLRFLNHPRSLRGLGPLPAPPEPVVPR